MGFSKLSLNPRKGRGGGGGGGTLDFKGRG